MALYFLGKLKPGGGQSWILPSPGHGRWWGHGYASVTVPCLSHGGEGMLGFGGHTQGTSACLALACRAVSGRRWLSCARRLAWGIRDLLPGPFGTCRRGWGHQGLGFSLGRGHV